MDHARKRMAGKRGGEIQRLSLEEGIFTGPGQDRELAALDDALTTLGQLNARYRQVVELRYFAGLSVAETAEVLSVSPETVARDRKFAKVFLYKEMKSSARN